MLLRVSVKTGQTVTQLVVPENLQTDMFNHIMMTWGARDIRSLMKRQLFWPGMDAFVSQKIKEC